MKREIVLDTETTGLSAKNGDKIVAVGAVELIDGKQTGKTFYAEINPLRSVPQNIARIHGLTDEILKDKPTFSQIAPSFLDFIGDSPLIIHNAPFDRTFLNAELTAAIGFPEAIVAKLLGHKQQSMTARYTHVTEDAVLQAADKITRKIAALLDIPERCAKPEDVKMFPRGIHLYKLHLVKPEEYPRPIPARKQRAAG